MQSKRLYQTILPAAAALLMLGVTSTAHAALERVGPTSNDPRIGGFPAWYQDTTGLALEFCDPLSASEVDGGWCLLLPGDVTIPEAFPTNFFDEHFYYAGDASLAPATGGTALLRVALESAFTTAVRQGDQITFTRIRVKLNPVPLTGTYRFIHPYGEEVIDAAAGDRIFFTDDIGIAAAPGDFTAAMNGRVGPFLIASSTAGGAEMPPVTAANPTPDTDPGHFGGAFTPTPYPGTGKAYLADRARLGPVTGSPLPRFMDSTGVLRDHNIFRIEGPAGSALGGVNANGTTIDFIETTDFSLMGRVFAETIPGRVTIDRSTYTASTSAQKVDVFASGFETTQGRLPAQPRPTPVTPVLSFYEGACGADAITGALIAPTGLTDLQMFQAKTFFSGQSQPLNIPTSVCVKDGAARDAAGNIVPAFFQAQVVDEIAITKALYDYDTQTLTVNAASSDAVNAPGLSLDGFGNLTAGQISVFPQVASPAKIRVRSTIGGMSELPVTINYSGAAPGALRALNDSFTFPEDSGAQRLNVLANDTSAAGGTVAVMSQPRLGTAVVNAADGSVTYTAAANASGADSFTYQVTTTAGKSNIANVALNISPVNDLPTAVNDGPFSIAAGGATTLPNLLDNDVDADGRADMVAAVNIVAPAGVTVTGGANGVVSVTAAAAGNYTFTYKVQDRAGAISANAATVTLTVIPADAVAVTRAQFTLAQKRWVVTGTTSIPNQTITLSYLNGTAAGHVIGTVPVDALGNWTLDLRGVTGLDDPTTLQSRPTTLLATSSARGSATVTITYK
jgi:hypothetical protein